MFSKVLTFIVAAYSMWFMLTVIAEVDTNDERLYINAGVLSLLNLIICAILLFQALHKKKQEPEKSTEKQPEIDPLDEGIWPEDEDARNESKTDCEVDVGPKKPRHKKPQEITESKVFRQRTIPPKRKGHAA